MYSVGEGGVKLRCSGLVGRVEELTAHGEVGGLGGDDGGGEGDGAVSWKFALCLRHACSLRWAMVSEM